MINLYMYIKENVVSYKISNTNRLRKISVALNSFLGVSFNKQIKWGLLDNIFDHQMDYKLFSLSYVKPLS